MKWEEPILRAPLVDIVDPSRLDSPTIDHENNIGTTFLLKLDVDGPPCRAKEVKERIYTNNEKTDQYLVYR